MAICRLLAEDFESNDSDLLDDTVVKSLAQVNSTPPIISSAVIQFMKSSFFEACYENLVERCDVFEVGLSDLCDRVQGRRERPFKRMRVKAGIS